MRFIRGNEISMIFQEPMTALNPLYTVEKQIYEVMKTHDRLVNPSLSKFDRLISSIKAPFRFLKNSILSNKIDSLFFTILLLTYLLVSCMGPNLISSLGTRFVVIFYASAEVSLSCTNYTDELISYCFLLIPFGILKSSIKSSIGRKEDFRETLTSIPYVFIAVLFVIFYDFNNIWSTDEIIFKVFIIIYGCYLLFNVMFDFILILLK